MRPRPTSDEADASIIAVMDGTYVHADPAGVCVVKDGKHRTLSAAQSCARNSFQIAWKREKAATQ